MKEILQFIEEAEGSKKKGDVWGNIRGNYLLSRILIAIRCENLI